MAITVVISATTAAASGAGTQFTTTGPFVLYGDNFAGTEFASLTRLGPSAAYSVMTNKDGAIGVGARPNSVYVEAAGTFRVDKPATVAAASIGYEEQ